MQVQVLLPGPHADKRFVQLSAEASYERLLDCGVELWNYQPTMLHAKTMTVDGIVATIGSANFNRRSLRCDEEVNLVVIDDQLPGALDIDFDFDLNAVSASSRDAGGRALGVSVSTSGSCFPCGVFPSLASQTRRPR